MWTQVTTATPARGGRRRRRLLEALAWTLIVSSVAAEATWGWAMNRSEAQWVPEVVRVVLEGVESRTQEGRSGPSSVELTRP